MEWDKNGGSGQVPMITLVLIAINVLVFFAIERNGSSLDGDYMIQVGAMYEPAVIGGEEYYRLITHFFLHFGTEHLINNMISLLVLGYALENDIGKGWFIGIYMFSGLFAGVVSLYVNMLEGDNIVSCGASGAIYGLMGALAVMLICGGRGRLRRSILNYLFYIVLSLYSGSRDSGIDNAAHVGGFIGGVLICIIVVGIKRIFAYRKEQVI